MGQQEEKGAYPAQGECKKTIEILAEFCDRWGYNRVVGEFKSCFLEGLSYRGYTVNYTITPVPRGKGEYFIYQILNGEKKIIFSNNKQLHGPQGAVFGYEIEESNIDKVVEKLQ